LSGLRKGLENWPALPMLCHAKSYRNPYANEE